jgi:hypothetical protein
MSKNYRQVDGSGGALPPLPTTADTLLSPPFVRITKRGGLDGSFKSGARSHLYRTRFHYMREARK